MFNILLEVFSNRIVFPAFVTAFLAQLLKTLIDFYKNKKFNMRQLISMGGMPSSHTATVASLVTSLARYENGGISSLGFGSSLVFAFIVMYDAVGIRQSAGNHAIIINKVVETIRDEEGKKLIRTRLKEVLGHTPIEVIMGGVFGFLVTWWICYYINPSFLI